MTFQPELSDFLLRRGATPSHRLATRPPRTEEMPRFHLRMSDHDIAQTRITAAWAQETCVLYPTDKASIEVSNVLPGRKEHIHTSAVCPPGAGLPRQAWNARRQAPALPADHVLRHLTVQRQAGDDFLSRKLRPWSGRWRARAPPSARCRFPGAGSNASPRGCRPRRGAACSRSHARHFTANPGGRTARNLGQRPGALPSDAAKARSHRQADIFDLQIVLDAVVTALASQT